MDKHHRFTVRKVMHRKPSLVAKSGCAELMKKRVLRFFAGRVFRFLFGR